VSTPTLTLTAPGPGDHDPVRVELALLAQQYGDLLRAAQATLAAHARHLPGALDWLREEVGRQDQLPAPGARPTDYVPTDTPGWGRR
jgi:hypothetical protein